MNRLPARAGRIARIAGAAALALLLGGCLDLPDETKDLLQVFVVVLAVNIILELVLILLLLFYFLPFTRPKRRPRRRR